MNQEQEQAAFTVAAEDVFSRESSYLTAIGALGPRLLSEFAQAEMDRRETEQRWLRDLRQYRGVYDPETLNAIGASRSKVFVRKTRVKVKTLDSRVADLLFPAGTEKNWTVEPTPKPTVPDEQLALIVQGLQQQAVQALQQAAPQDGQPPQPQQPPQITPEMVEKAVADHVKHAATKMGRCIEDQLVEARYKDACLKAVHSGHLYGTGVLKGPLVDRKVRTRFAFEDGAWRAKSEHFIVPFVDYVPLWRLYPDMNATTIEGCRYVYERHLMSRAELAELAERKSFAGRAHVIRGYIHAHPRGELKPRTVDNELKIIGERQANQAVVDGQYEILERWGWLAGEELQDAGVEVPTDRVHEAFFSNVWLLPNGEVIKAVLQPLNGVTWPYHFYHFDKDETTIFPEGLASVMRDDQTTLNAAHRMILDNGALTSGPMFEVSPHLLSNLERLDEFVPWKAFIRNAQQPGARAINMISMDSKLNELGAISSRFEANIDETTAIPRYMSGENATQGAAGTAAGMSMLMGAANIVIKDLVTAWDEGVTRPFLEAMYRWNMQFNTDMRTKGDFDVKARGAASLVAKEVRARMLNEFAAMTANPMDAPYIHRDRLNQLRAEAMEMGNVVKTQEEVEQEAQSGPMAMQNQLMQMQAQLELAAKEAKVALMQAEVAMKQAQAERIRAETIDKKVEAVFAALQAAGVAVQNTAIAPAGDEILKSAGWVDATPQSPMSEIAANAPDAPAAVMARDAQPETGQVGANAGMNTATLND